MANHFTKALIAKRLRTKRRLPRPTRAVHPDAVKNIYFSDMKRLLAALKTVTEEVLITGVRPILAAAQAARPTADSSRADAYGDDIKGIVAKAKIQFELAVPKGAAREIARRIAERTSSFNAHQMNQQFKSVIGVDPFRNERWLEQEMKSFVSQNVDLITSIPEEYFGRIEKTVFKAARAGTLSRDLEKEILPYLREEFDGDLDKAENRAALIARDQVAKFNGQLTGLRQQEVGVTQYTWQTAEDDRVRPMHADLDQTVQSWDDPPVTNSSGDTNNPGEDYNCRCVAIPIFGDVEE